MKTYKVYYKRFTDLDMEYITTESLLVNVNSPANINRELTNYVSKDLLICVVHFHEV